MNEFDFNVRTLCLMDKSELTKLLKKKDSDSRFSTQEIEEALRIYDTKNHKKRRQKKQKDV